MFSAGRRHKISLQKALLFKTGHKPLLVETPAVGLGAQENLLKVQTGCLLHYRQQIMTFEYLL